MGLPRAANLSSSLWCSAQGTARAPGFDPAPFSSTTTCRLAFRRRWLAARAYLLPPLQAGWATGAGPSISTPTRRWRRSSRPARHGPMAHQPSVRALRGRTWTKGEGSRPGGCRRRTAGQDPAQVQGQWHPREAIRDREGRRRRWRVPYGARRQRSCWSSGQGTRSHGCRRDRQPAPDLLLQEGVPTFERINGAVAEPVVYLIDRYVVGGFYWHAGRGADEDLSAPGRASSARLRRSQPARPGVKPGPRTKPLLHVRRDRAPGRGRGELRARSHRSQRRRDRRVSGVAADLFVHDVAFARRTHGPGRARAGRGIDAVGPCSRRQGTPRLGAAAAARAAVRRRALPPRRDALRRPAGSKSGTLLEGIALWGELKPLLTQGGALVERALAMPDDWAVAKGPARDPLARRRLRRPVAFAVGRCCTCATACVPTWTCSSSPSRRTACCTRWALANLKRAL